MKFNKGDLIAVKTYEEQSSSAIILALFNEGQFLYCYVLETGLYRLIYAGEVEYIISKDFNPEFEIDEDIFNIDYSFYEACSEMFSYSPYFGYPVFDDDDSDEDDE